MKISMHVMRKKKSAETCVGSIIIGTLGRGGFKKSYENVSIVILLNLTMKMREFLCLIIFPHNLFNPCLPMVKLILDLTPLREESVPRKCVIMLATLCLQY